MLDNICISKDDLIYIWKLFFFFKLGDYSEEHGCSFVDIIQSAHPSLLIKILFYKQKKMEYILKCCEK